MSKACELCKTDVPAATWEQHIKGKNHQKLLGKLKMERNSLETSVFVTHFPIGTNESELKEYFKTFGNISRIIFDKNRGAFAIIWFENRNIVQDILRQTHVINGKVVTVQPKRPSNQPNMTNQDNKSKEENLQNAILCLKNCRNFEDQLETLVRMMKFSKKNSENRMNVCKSVQDTINQIIPNCVAVPFGSSANGLETLDCDLDIDVSISMDHEEDVSKQETDASSTIKLVMSSSLPLSENILKRIYSMSGKSLVRLVAEILKKYGPGCQNIMAIPTARQPVIKFSHRYTKLDCDLVINGLGVQNTSLIAFLQQLDVKIHQLLLVIRIWAKVRFACYSPTRKLTSYAFVLLAIFYLQTLKHPLLPSIETLQMLADDTIIIKGWLVHFCNEISKLPPTNNNDSTIELIKGFFNFYADMDFTKVVICPLKGCLYTKEQFLDADFLHISFKNESFPMSRISVQDPFELCHNTTKHLITDGLGYLVQGLREAQLIVNSPEFENKFKFDTWGIMLLFQQSCSTATNVEVNPPTTLKQEQLQTNEDDLTSALAKVTEFVFKLNFDTSLRESLAASGDNLTSKLLPENEWFMLGANTMKDVIQIALKFKCTVVKPSKKGLNTSGQLPASRKRPFPEEDLNSEEADPNNMKDLTYHFYSFFRTWCGRKKMKQISNAETNILEMEGEISKKIMQENADARTRLPVVDFTCVVSVLNQSEKIVEVKFYPKTSLKEFRSVFSFFQSYIPKLLNRILPYKGISCKLLF